MQITLFLSILSLILNYGIKELLCEIIFRHRDKEDILRKHYLSIHDYTQVGSLHEKPPQFQGNIL